ncbi:hypothetical protein H0H92_014365 [Tricholoma furcatifolium]|nr:hypothetical protein H0H92_014365 [Tricholoma furcatifolium]
MAAEHSAFSTSGEDVITRSLDVHADTTADELSPSDFDEFYDIPRTADEIVKGDYKRVALQFPDELLHVSVPIYRRLKAKIGDGRELYVLADTSYGRQAPAITMHIITSRLPVIYVFGHKPLDISSLITSVEKFFRECLSARSEEDGVEKWNTILLRHDVGYTHLAGIVP